MSRKVGKQKFLLARHFLYAAFSAFKEPKPKLLVVDFTPKAINTINSADGSK